MKNTCSGCGTTQSIRKSDKKLDKERVKLNKELRKEGTKYLFKEGKLKKKFELEQKRWKKFSSWQKFIRSDRFYWIDVTNDLFNIWCSNFHNFEPGYGWKYRERPEKYWTCKFCRGRNLFE